MITWTERGGLPVVAPTGAGGFGSKLLSRAMTQQLDGRVERTWDEAGIIMTLTMNRSYLAA